MKSRTIYIFIILSLLHLKFFGQVSVSGIILSGVNQQPLNDVSIRINLSGAATDENGAFFFEYKPKPKDSLVKIEFAALGYITVDFILDITRQQQYNFKLTLAPYNGIDRNMALNDIKNGNVKILLSGGIAPVFYKADRRFSRKYKVQFIEFGCEAIAPESLTSYNSTVFDYLDKTYGKKWRKKIRKDVVGL
ncbi:MAG: hypothetical protein KDC69_12085 [Flavobacteriaceae bacterium]|nr:hypothetical protein [Flavobacteriaceae bacterium]